tara:strand:- start:1375 stop:4932 length:3558 start_codon:yes stop_codon:yes gene_type:complete
MGFSAGVGFLVDTDGDGTNDGKVVTLKKGSNITLSLTGSTLTISSTGGSGAVRTVTVDGVALDSSESLDLVSGEGIDLSESGGDVTIAGEDATTTNKGIASFSSDNFDVTSGAVKIKAGGVDLTNEVTGTLPVANGGTGATSLNDLITLGTHTTGNYVATIADSGGGTITVANSGSESAGVTLAVDTSVIASKTYVDSVAQGLRVADAVAVATTTNITLSGEQTIDGITTSTSRVLVKNQSTATENGIYVSASGAWARASDMNADTSPNEFPGTFVFVSGGTTNADLGFVCTVDTDFDLGTDDVTFSQFSSAGHITAGSGLDKSGNTMSVDVSDFMTNGADNRVVTATGTDSMTAESNFTFDGTKVEIQGSTTDDVALTITNAQDTNNDETVTLRLKSTRGTDSDFEIVHDVFGNTEFFSNQPDSDTDKFMSFQNVPKIVFNPNAIDMDVQFAGDSESNLLYLDAGNDRVGIGTNSPTVKLEVSGDTTIARSADLAQTRTLIIEGARNATGTDYARIDLKNYDSHGPTSYVGARIGAINEADGVNDGSLIFSTNNANAGLVERMRIKDSGEVVIGTDLQLSTSSDDAIIENVTSDKDIIFKVNDGGSTTEVMRIDGELSSIRIGQSTSSATDGPDAKLDVRGANDNSVSIMASGALSVENSAEISAPSSRAYAFLSVDNGNAMVGGNLRLDDSVSGGSHDGYASGTDARGGAGIILTNTSSSDDGQIQFVRQNDSNNDTWTVKESMRINASGYLGINDTDPISELSVAGKISITSESSTPTAPADGHGWLYTKSDGKIYWQSNDVAETDLTGGGGAVSEAFKTISVAGQSDVVADSATDTLTFAAGSNIAITTDPGGDQVTISATGTISGGITVQEEGVALSTLGDTLNFVGSSVTATGTGTTKTITISGGGAFVRDGNLIKTTETIGVGGTNVEELSLLVPTPANSEAVMTNSGTNTSVVTSGMGIRKNVTIVAADADTGEDTYTVADTDHIIMICNVKPSDATPVASQTLKTVQLPTISTDGLYGREITVTLHALSGHDLDLINVKPAGDDAIIYHGKMWDNNLTAGDHTFPGSALGGLGMTMGHSVITDANWVAMNQVSVISVTMVALKKQTLGTLLGADPVLTYSATPEAWDDAGASATADVWLVTQVSGVNGLISNAFGLGRQIESNQTGGSIIIGQGGK